MLIHLSFEATLLFTAYIMYNQYLLDVFFLITNTGKEINDYIHLSINLIKTWGLSLR